MELHPHRSVNLSTLNHLSALVLSEPPDVCSASMESKELTLPSAWVNARSSSNGQAVSSPETAAHKLPYAAGLVLWFLTTSTAR